jgi:hypothetical protein
VNTLAPRAYRIAAPSRARAYLLGGSRRHVDRSVIGGEGRRKMKIKSHNERKSGSVMKNGENNLAENENQ